MSALEQMFKQELVDAAAWYDGVKSNEVRWIENGVDVDEKFTETYYQVLGVGSLDKPSPRLRYAPVKLVAVFIAVAGIAALVILRFAVFRRRPAKAVASANE